MLIYIAYFNSGPYLVCSVSVIFLTIVKFSSKLSRRMTIVESNPDYKM